MTIFEKTGPVNTEETLNIALKTAKERNLDIVVASSEGDTALSLMQKAKEAGFARKDRLCQLCLWLQNTGRKPLFSGAPHYTRAKWYSCRNSSPCAQWRRTGTDQDVWQRTSGGTDCLYPAHVRTGNQSVC